MQLLILSEAGIIPLLTKGFDLTIFMNFVVGNDVFSMSTQRFIGPYLANQNTLEKMKNRFTLIDPSTGKEKY